jgi:hypothetical protein
MSWWQQITMVCDGCGNAEPADYGSKPTVKRSREIVAKRGWQYENGEDFCLDCNMLLERMEKEGANG